MSNIIDFSPRKKRVFDAETKTGSAEVLIFPGIRVERKNFSLADRLVETVNGKEEAKPAKSKARKKQQK